MWKNILKYAFPIICVIIVIVAFYMIFNIRSRVDDELYNTNDIADNTEVENYAVENETENEVENEVTNDTANETVENTSNVQNVLIEEEDIEEGSTAKKQEAINLVKKQWGEDNTVSFRCETVNSKGEYVVAVVYEGTVKAYFNVNLETKSVEIDV